MLGLGKLIGKRTWGGVTGIRESLPLADGGQFFKPEFAIDSKDGQQWVVEGHGSILTSWSTMIPEKNSKVKINNSIGPFRECKTS